MFKIKFPTSVGSVRLQKFNSNSIQNFCRPSDKYVGRLIDLIMSRFIAIDRPLCALPHMPLHRLPIPDANM